MKREREHSAQEVLDFPKNKIIKGKTFYNMARKNVKSHKSNFCSKQKALKIKNMRNRLYLAHLEFYENHSDFKYKT